MNNESEAPNPPSPTLDQLGKLMVIGYVCPKPGCQSVEVQRGMSILAADGQEAGKVAAILLSRHACHATHILLGHLPHLAKYRLIRLGLISHVSVEGVHLTINYQEVQDLPLWRSTSSHFL